MLRDIAVIINGRLGGDPTADQVNTKNGMKTVARISIAANNTFMSGEKNETCWFSLTLWGKTAEYFLQYAKKGDGVYIIAEPRPDPETGKPKLWKDKDGNIRSQWGLDNVQTCQLIQRGEGKREARSGGYGNYADAPGFETQQDQGSSFNFAG